MQGRLLIRADASTKVGAGHVMRSLALAEIWQKYGGEVVFATAQPPPGLVNRLQLRKIPVLSLSNEAGSDEDIQAVILCCHRMKAKWVVLDGYRFDEVYQRQLKEAGLSVLVVDDFGQSPYYWADLVVNQGLGAHENLYPGREPYTRLLMGTSFALIRNEFLKYRAWQRSFALPARKFLINMGGGDPFNMTQKALEALQFLPIQDISVVVVVGVVNPFREIIETIVKQMPFKARIVCDPLYVSDLMSEADLAISSGGSTLWEMAFMGLPSLTISMSQRQTETIEELAREGIVKALGWHEDLSPEVIAGEIMPMLNVDAGEVRSRMSSQGRKFIDGEGSFRIWLKMNQGDLRFSPAGPEDCRVLYEWACDEQTREFSFNPGFITWERHVSWFQNKWQKPDYFLWMVKKSDGKNVGEVHFEIQVNERATFYWTVSTELRRQGWGTLIAWCACLECFRTTSVSWIQILLHPKNKPAFLVLKRLGFTRRTDQSGVVNGLPALVMEISRQQVLSEL